MKVKGYDYAVLSRNLKSDLFATVMFEVLSLEVQTKKGFPTARFSVSPDLINTEVKCKRLRELEFVA